MAKSEVRRRKGGKVNETPNRSTGTNDVSKEFTRSANSEETARSSNIPVNISDLVMMVSLVFGGCCL